MFVLEIEPQRGCGNLGVSLAQESRATSGAAVASLDSFVSCLTKMDLLEVSLPARLRLAGEFETFLSDVLNIQVSIGTNLPHNPLCCGRACQTELLDNKWFWCIQTEL